MSRVLVGHQIELHGLHPMNGNVCSCISWLVMWLHHVISQKLVSIEDGEQHARSGAHICDCRASASIANPAASLRGPKFMHTCVCVIASDTNVLQFSLRNDSD